MIFSIENLDYDSLQELYQVTLEIIRLHIINMVLKSSSIKQFTGRTIRCFGSCLCFIAKVSTAPTVR